MPKTTKSKAKTSKKGGAKAPAKTKKKTTAAAQAASETAGDQPVEAQESKRQTAKDSGKKAAPRRKLAPKTPFVKWGEGQDSWLLIDAAGQPLGRLSSHIANVLMGKHKPSYTRFSDTGDHVVVINAKNVVLTGNKWSQKTYYYHTNYPGGIKSFTAQQLLETYPERLIERAVYGMLPKGHMGRRWYKKLRVFSGSDHPHTAQKPQAHTLPNLGVWENK